MTTDPKAAAAFYAQVAGWNLQAMGEDYTVLLQGQAGVGGVMALPQEARDHGGKPGWLGYVFVDDVDAFAGRVTAAGGALHKGPGDIPTIGRFAVVSDPQGAVFILFKPLPTEVIHRVDPAAPGAMGWRELMAADGEAAFAFYAGLFGWTRDQAFQMGPMGTYQMFAYGSGEPAEGGMMTKLPEMPAPFWSYYIRVDGIEAATARLVAAGGTVIMAPHQVPDGSWIVQATDPQGAMFSLVSLNA
jgi:predicted enzyme related to lactoylglutathione lyase